MARTTHFIQFAAASLCMAAGLLAAAPAGAETLKVGATSTGIPFTFLDVKTGKIEGMMVDVANAVAKASGDQAEITQTVFSALIPSLTTKKIDFISAAMIQTPARAEVVDFTDPVYDKYGDGLIVKQGETADIKSLDDLQGKTLGVQAGTVYYNIATKKGGFKAIRTYDSIADMARDLALGRIDAGLGDKPIMAYQIKTGNLKGVELAPHYVSIQVGHISLVVRKGDAKLLKTLNAGIAKIKANGDLDKIIAKWGI